MNRIIREDIEYIVSTDLPWSDLSAKTVLITGANGFLPAYMVETLLFLNERFHLGIDVICLVRSYKKASKRFYSYMRRPDFSVVEQDVCHPICPQGDVHYIIHAASQASPKYYGVDPVGTLTPNVLGTYHLLELARSKHTLSFLFFSSGEIYGKVSDHQIPTSEEDYGSLDPTAIRSCYAESKRMGENMCVSWYHQFGVPAKIVRPSHTYGPGMSLDDGRVFADFVSDVVHNRNITMCSDGKATRPFCYLADAVVAYFMVLLKGIAGQAYNVGSDKETSIVELAYMLARLFPEKRLKVVTHETMKEAGYINSTINRGCPDISKIRALGWKPSFTLEEGFTRTVKSFI